MKKIHLLILKSFIRPFIVTFLIVMFVLLMLFLFKYIDDLIGKGFEWYVILQLMMYVSATNVAMALPLSILLSSIMTYGTLGENYELVAIKSAGVSLNRAMYPMIIVVTILSIIAFFFSNYMLPVANQKFYSLLYDVRQQKSAKLLDEGVFSSRFPGFAIRVEKKDPDGQTLHGLMIYKNNETHTDNSVIFAKEGLMYRSPDDKFLVIKLKDGIQYEEKSDNGTPRQQLQRMRFKETVQKLDLSSFTLKRTDQNEWRSQIQMMNLKMLAKNRDSIYHLIDSGLHINERLISPYLKYFGMPFKPVKGLAIDKAYPDYLSHLKRDEQISVVTNALNEARSVSSTVKQRATRYVELTKEVRRTIVEYQKKFTLPAACIALFLIGAPLGAIIRKGGLGMPVVVAVSFFLLYYIITTIGEKSAKDGDLSPAVGMWISIVILTPIGLFLSYKSANDSVIFDMESYKRFFNKIWKRKLRLRDH